jgi:hypothetical protein
MVDDDGATGAEGLGGVSGVGRDHRRVSRPQTSLLLTDDQQDLPLDYVPDLLLRMIVLVQIGGSLGDVPVAECHVRRVKEPTGPSGKRGAT